jgi:hypothetical protein
MDLVTYADGDLAVDILHSIWKMKPDVSFYVAWLPFLKLHDVGTVLMHAVPHCHILCSTEFIYKE